MLSQLTVFGRSSSLIHHRNCARIEPSQVPVDAPSQMVPPEWCAVELLLPSRCRGDGRNLIRRLGTLPYLLQMCDL